MKLYGKKENCTGCGACVNGCTQQAIQMCTDLNGFAYPKVDEKKCTHCGQCKLLCPQNASAKYGKPDNTGEPLYVGAKSLEYEERMNSSSGGLFSLFAKQILKSGGYVCAAALDEDMVVRHTLIHDVADLERLRKTKYVQSEIGSCFSRIKEIVSAPENKKVLFVGTPCQCQGLLRCLGEQRENLYTASLVCYGVPSPKVFQNYVRFLEKKHGAKLKSFSFRDKRKHDSGHTVSYLADKEYAHELYKDPYCRLFFRNHILRPSCFSCKYTTTNRNTDITLGDFWGIEKVKPEFDDGDGTSLVICHSEKGKQLWDVVKDGTEYFTCQREDILQPRLLEPVNRAKSKVYPAAGLWIKRAVFKGLEK